MSEVEEKLEQGGRTGPMRRVLSRICTPIFLEAFILTFLAEWGDRSQIATIALAAHLDPYGAGPSSIHNATITPALNYVCF